MGDLRAPTFASVWWALGDRRYANEPWDSRVKPKAGPVTSQSMFQFPTPLCQNPLPANVGNEQKTRAMLKTSVIVSL